ncbi:MAG: hypothetical protein HUK15_08430 [Bacteroidales bacterium]|nr:hypothetical protein [Bacteroidales bacterium]
MKSYASKLVIFLLTSISFCLIPSCDNQEYVPYVYVNIQLYPDMPAHSALKTPGNYIYVEGGYKGIVVTCVYPNEFVAFDRACPSHPRAKDAVLSVDSTGLFLECSQCGAKFNLNDGALVSGNSKYTPQQYLTSYEGAVLYIYNSYY